MTNPLQFPLPPDCSGEYLLSLMERRRQPELVHSLAVSELVLYWNGTRPDRELARAEVAAGLVEAGSTHTEVRFADESVP